ncbi:MAG: hypothetical protein ABIJ18_02750 [archaeon]
MKKLMIMLFLVLLLFSFVSAATEKECLIHNDCDLLYGEGYACNDGTCEVDEKRGYINDIECLINTDCEDNFYCGEEGFCLEVVVTCDLDEECDEGYICSESICIVEDITENGEEVTPDETTDEVTTSNFGDLEFDETITQEIELSQSCLISADCPYVDDLCYKGLCLQGELDDEGNVVVSTPQGKEKLNIVSCSVDSDCAFREFCDNTEIGNQNGFCSKTPQVVETNINIAKITDPLINAYDSARILVSNDIDKAIIQTGMTERLMDKSRTYEALALQGKIDIEKVESIQEKVNIQLDNLDQRTQILKDKQLDPNLLLEQGSSFTIDLEKIESQKIDLEFDRKRDLSRASIRLDSPKLQLQEQNLQIANNVKESLLTPEDIALKQNRLQERQILVDKRLEQSQLSEIREVLQITGTPIQKFPETDPLPTKIATPTQVPTTPTPDFNK